MADASQAATSLLTEHLQYTPLSLIDDIINCVNQLVLQVLISLETGLTSMPPAELGFKTIPSTVKNVAEEGEFPNAKHELEEGLHKLETLLYSAVDKNFDKFEIYTLRNILSVPAELVHWIRLSHYENLSYPPPQNAPTVESVQLLRSKLAAERDTSRTLLKEYNRNEAILQQLRSLSGYSQTAPNSLSFLNNGSSTQPQNLSTNTNFAVSQLPALKALLSELRPKLAALEDANNNAATARDELKEERRGYIEQRTRSHLQRNGAKLPDQSAAVSGRRVDSKEVQALEKVAAIFDPA